MISRLFIILLYRGVKSTGCLLNFSVYVKYSISLWITTVLLGCFFYLKPIISFKILRQFLLATHKQVLSHLPECIPRLYSTRVYILVDDLRIRKMIPKTKVYVVGVGMTKFEKPGRRDDFDYPQMAKEAVTKALEDARLSYSSVQSVCVGYVYGDSTSGQRAVYEVGLSGCPIYNVNNNCSTGSSALHLGKQIIESKNADCVLALGFEKMERGSLSAKYLDRTNPMEKHVGVMADIAGK